MAEGVLCATLTPLVGAGTPAMPLLLEHCRWLLDSGCSGIVLLGTTGEANSFTVSERRAILAGVLAGGIDPSSLIVGTGACAVGDTVALTRDALAAGCARVLMLPPFYYKGVSDAGVIDAYTQTIEAIGDDRLRVFLYRIPQLSGVEISPAVVDELRRRFASTIAGIKDSSGDWQSVRALIGRFAGELDMLVGSERFLLDALAAGATGCVTATANATAPLVARTYAGRDGADASSLQERATVARAQFEALPVIPALKAAVADRTGDPRWRTVRPPLVKLDDAHAAALVAHRDEWL